jgi:hypothetical protein
MFCPSLQDHSPGWDEIKYMNIVHRTSTVSVLFFLLVDPKDANVEWRCGSDEDFVKFSHGERYRYRIEQIFRVMIARMRGKC